MRATWAGDVDSIETNQTPKRKPPQRRITVVGINAVEDQQPPPDTGKGLIRVGSVDYKVR